MLDVSDSRFLPSVLMTILGAIFIAAYLLSCCRRGPSRSSLIVFFYMSEYSDLLASLAVFVILPAEISKLLRQKELDTSAEEWGWTELERSTSACEAWCRPTSCNHTDCAGCGLCNVSMGEAASQCPKLQVERCAFGSPEIVVDCPELTTNVPLPVYILHALMSSVGVVHVLSSLVTNPQQFRSYGFYAFVVWRRRGRWFQYYLRAFVLLLALELIASILLAAGNGGNSHADRSVRVYEICGVMLAILVDLASQCEKSGDAPSTQTLACSVGLALPCYMRASTAMSTIDHAMLSFFLNQSDSQSVAGEEDATPPDGRRDVEDVAAPLERLVLAGRRAKVDAISELRDAMAASSQRPSGRTGSSACHAKQQQDSASDSARPMGSHSHGRLSAQLVAVSPRLARQLSGSAAGVARHAHADELQRLQEMTLPNAPAAAVDETHVAASAVGNAPSQHFGARHGASSVPPRPCEHLPQAETNGSSEGSTTAQPTGGSRWPSTARVLTTGRI